MRVTLVVEPVFFFLLAGKWLQLLGSLWPSSSPASTPSPFLSHVCGWMVTVSINYWKLVFSFILLRWLFILKEILYYVFILFLFSVFNISLHNNNNNNQTTIEHFSGNLPILLFFLLICIYKGFEFALCCIQNNSMVWWSVVQ